MLKKATVRIKHFMVTSVIVFRYIYMYLHIHVCVVAGMLYFKYVLMCAGSFRVPANYVNQSIANVQASVFKLLIFCICV